MRMYKRTIILTVPMYNPMIMSPMIVSRTIAKLDNAIIKSA